MTIGIYAICHIGSSKLYIGSSERCEFRFSKEHLPDLRANVHYTTPLQRAFNKYGEAAFVMRILEEYKGDNFERDRDALERKHLHAYPREWIYNVHLEPGRPPGTAGTKLTDEHRQKLSDAAKADGRVPPSAAGRVYGPYSEERRENIRQSLKGRKLTEDQIARRTETRRKNKNGGY